MMLWLFRGTQVVGPAAGLAHLPALMLPCHVAFRCFEAIVWPAGCSRCLPQDRGRNRRFRQDPYRTHSL